MKEWNFPFLTFSFVYGLTKQLQDVSGSRESVVYSWQTMEEKGRPKKVSRQTRSL